MNSNSNNFIKNLKKDYDSFMTYCALCTTHNITENSLRKIIKIHDWKRKKPSKFMHDIIDKKIKVDKDFLKFKPSNKKSVKQQIKESAIEEIKDENKDKIIDDVVNKVTNDIINPRPKRIRKKKQEEPDDDKQPLKTCNVNIDDVKNISPLTTKINKDCKK